MKVHCSKCGGTRTTPVGQMLDERYPVVACSDCDKRVVGIREDIFNRRSWEQQRAAEAESKALRKVLKPAARGR